VHLVFWLVALIAVVCAVTAAADRWGISAPLILVLVGVLGSYLPFVPDVQLDSEVVLAGILPPLLYAAAIRTSLIDFRANRRAIGALSIGYVLFGTVAVGAVAHVVFGIGWAPALALGAVLAPPDAVAATAVARRIGLPKRLVDVLEGESLVNDATAIVCLRTALAAMTVQSVSAWQVVGSFAVAAGGGVAVGVAVAWIVIKLRPLLTDVVRSTALSFAIPFVAYVGAESWHASGVLAVVVAGLLIGHKSPMQQTGPSRLAERINWETVQFLLENAVFLLIGLQVKLIVQAVEGDSLGPARIWWGCLIILVAVLVLRPVWVFPAMYLPRLIPALRRKDSIPSWKYPAVLSWAGMRGVVTLAAVFILPADLEHQPVLALSALIVVGGTLLIQGFTLPALVRALDVRGPDPREDLLQQAVVLQETAEAGLAELERSKRPDDPVETLDALRGRMEQRRLAAWERLGGTDTHGETPSERFIRLRLAMLAAERARVLQLRSTSAIPHHVLADVLAVLDVEEALVTSWGHPDEIADGRADLVTPEGVRGGCDHLQQAPVAMASKSGGQCQDCLAEGLTWVHLRMCLTCGNVGCCESSPGYHSQQHYRETGHPVMRSIEPGEAWRWCFVDDLLG
jgi:monovalent cation/hydrogen antiporter